MKRRKGGAGAFRPGMDMGKARLFLFLICCINLRQFIGLMTTPQMEVQACYYEKCEYSTLVTSGLGPFEAVENEKSRAAALFFPWVFLEKKGKNFHND